VTDIKLPPRAKFTPSHELCGDFAISADNDLVYVARHANAPEDRPHSVELPLQGIKAFQIAQWPRNGDAHGLDGDCDDAIGLEVDRIEIEVHGALEIAQCFEIKPGCVLVSDSGTYLIGEKIAAGAPNAINFDDKKARYLSHGSAMYWEHWTLHAYRGDIKVFDVTR